MIEAGQPLRYLNGNGDDSFVDMMCRRIINIDYAVDPLDSYAEGLQVAGEHTTFGHDDKILDVGTSNGQFIIEAARKAGITSYLVGVDVLDEPYRHFPIEGTDRADACRFSFVQGDGLHLPFADDSFRAVTAHKVLFRPGSRSKAAKMLGEIVRVTEPEGMVVVSTSGKLHARERYKLEREVATRVARLAGIARKPLATPARGFFLEDVPAIASSVGGLELVDQVNRPSEVRITPGVRLETYLFSLKLSASKLSDDPAVRLIWRQVVEEWARPYLERRIRLHEVRHRGRHGTAEPHFADTVDTGLFVFRKTG